MGQFAVSLALILWMVLGAPRSAAGFCLQVSATAASLWPLGLLGVWLLPPWWVPYGFAGMFLAATWVALRQRRPCTSVWPATRRAGVVTALFVALGRGRLARPAGTQGRP